jgi:hypothetical protein
VAAAFSGPNAVSDTSGTALALAATPIGRIGDAIVRIAGLPDGFIGTGAVHVGAALSNSASST